uniref:J domain-containing protein n=1 Tax=Saimiri boliviensis boliviensis TaxID=39432 RepID=A0A2K6UMC1_SAIBB
MSHHARSPFPILNKSQAAELLHQLSQASEVLTHAAARAAYDKVRKAKKQAAERKRKNVKLDLEARERQAQAQASEEEEEESRSTRTLEQGIQRLREEGSRQPEEQQRLIREQKRQEHDQKLRGKTENTEGQGTPRLKLKWKCKKEGEAKGGYSKDVLNLVHSGKKAGTAVVEFATVRAAELAVQNEVGLVDDPLKISWLEGQPQDTMGRSHPGLSEGSVLRERDRTSLERHDAHGQQLIARMGREDQEGPPT